MEIENKKWKVNPDFVLRDMSEESVLLFTGDNEIFENNFIFLNETARYIWKILQQPHSVQEVIEQMQREYHDPDGKMEQEVRKFISDFADYGLLKEEK